MNPRTSLLLISAITVGEISTRLALDREQQSSYQLFVVVQDGGTPPRSATGTAHISVLDENDHAPTFTHVRPDTERMFEVREVAHWELSMRILSQLEKKNCAESKTSS